MDRRRWCARSGVLGRGGEEEGKGWWAGMLVGRPNGIPLLGPSRDGWWSKLQIPWGLPHVRQLPSSKHKSDLRCFAYHIPADWLLVIMRSNKHRSRMFTHPDTARNVPVRY